jgi:hypothetical protein
MSDRVDDHSMDGKKSHRVDLSIDPECYVLVGHHTNVTDDRNDLNLDVSRGLRMSDLLGDHSMDDDRHDVLVGHHKNVKRDLNLDENLDVSRGLRMSDLLDDHSMVVSHVNRNYAHHDRKTDVNRVNRNYVPPDLNRGASLVVMNHHVKLMVYLSMSCDRMSHDHLRCGHLKMRRRDMNRMDGMNLDGKMKIHHDCWY